MTLAIGQVDAAVLMASLAGAIAVGLFAGGRARSLDAYLLGDRSLPWWVVMGSIVATETSTATVLSVPGEGFGPVGLRFLQLPLGFMLGRLAIVRWLLPLYFEGRLNTAHELLGRRFGPVVQRAAALLFLVTRNLGDGLRLFLAAIVLARLTGIPFLTAIAVMGSITILYTVLGGIRSVAWNDCLQLVIYLFGGIAALFIIAGRIPGGWTAAWEHASTTGRLQLFDFRFNLANPVCFWAGLIGGGVLSLGTHGTDHMMVQRYLASGGLRQAGRALAGSGIAVVLQFALFLVIGILLAAYHATTGEAAPARPDEVFAAFVVNHFPRDVGLIGLLLAAILAAAMSTLSSSLNASASAVMHDFLLPRVDGRGPAQRPHLRPETQLLISRGLTVVFGLIQIAVGIAATRLDETVIRSALAIAGVAAGLLLGVFGLGLGTKRVGAGAALTGAGCGLAALLAVQFLLPTRGIVVAFPWYALIGGSVTFTVGLAASIIWPRPLEHSA
ncbi:MAG: Na(+)/glucose symporter [Planctomycetota bacterium]|jgi:SSS family transporter